MEKEQEVLLLREKGLTPKEIARKLALKVSVVSEILRASAEQNTLSKAESGELAPIAECFVNSNCPKHLLLNQNDEPTEEYGGENGCIVLVWVARTSGYERYEVCTYLVDHCCLGLKDTIGIRRFNGIKYREFLEVFYRQSNGYREISLEQAQAIVLGAVEYAKGLGLEPHKDFEQTRSHLGKWENPIQLKFGQDGKPFYFQGPYDDTNKILKALRENVGEGNFHYVVGLGG